MTTVVNTRLTAQALAVHQAAFLASILPAIEAHGRVAFGHVRCRHRREDNVQEMRALGWKWSLKLWEKGKDPSRFASAIAVFAARHVRSGRKLCGQEAGKDCLSPTAQARHGFVA